MARKSVYVRAKMLGSGSSFQRESLRKVVALELYGSNALKGKMAIGVRLNHPGKQVG